MLEKSDIAALVQEWLRLDQVKNIILHSFLLLFLLYIYIYKLNYKTNYEFLRMTKRELK